MNELRRRLAAIAGAALDDDILDQIRRSLVASDEAMKVPVTVKYSFEVDKDGILSVDVESKCNLALMKQRVHLVHDHNQLHLDFVEKSADEPGVALEVLAEAEQDAKARKDQKVRKGVKTEPAPEQESLPKKRGSGGYGDQRLHEIRAQSVELYRKGEISRGLAIAAGVDVDKIDSEKEKASEFSIDDLSADEKKALESSLA